VVPYTSVVPYNSEVPYQKTFGFSHLKFDWFELYKTHRTTTIMTKVDIASPHWATYYPKLFQWLDEVHMSLCCDYKNVDHAGAPVVTVARILFTKFLHFKGSMLVKDIQKYGVAAYNIALKHLCDDASGIPLAKIGAFVTANAYSWQDICDAEFHILDGIEWRIPSTLDNNTLTHAFVGCESTTIA
jgi:hypothetical protein